MTATRVTTNAAGETVSETSLYGTGGVTSSNDYEASGVTVRSGLHNRTVSAADQVADSDIVVVDGMEITAKMARELGLMRQVFDEGLSIGAAKRAAEGHHGYQPEDGPDDIEKTGHEAFDAAVADLNDQIEAGGMDYAEASEYHTALGEIALAGLTAEQVTETVAGIQDGTADLTGLDANTRAVVENVERKVTATATASAKAELGQAGFNRLAEIARGNPEVNEAITAYAIMRAQGRADVSWGDFLSDAEDHVRGIR